MIKCYFRCSIKMCNTEETRCSDAYTGYCFNGGVCCHTEFTTDPFCMLVFIANSFVLPLFSFTVCHLCTFILFPLFIYNC